MQSEVWNKYLPVIRIVLKMSLVSEQTLALNSSDFLLAGFTKKLGYHFTIKINKGKIDNVIIDHPLAASLATSLKSDKQLKTFFEDKEFHLTLNPKYVLTIKYVPQEEMIEATEA